jgi:outer membrane protein OmpA-like peptidoglycan-associated protein
MLLPTSFCLLLACSCASVSYQQIAIAQNDLERLKIAGAETCAPKQYKRTQQDLLRAKQALGQNNRNQTLSYYRSSQELLKELEAKVQQCKVTDSDNDNILDYQDLAPDQPEDKDNFQDEDGVPDPDNDQDGVPDTKDRALNDPEDKDGFQDEDGKPDPDNDGDGILDGKDPAPNEAEDFDGYQDEDGIPDEDNDNDGIPDWKDGAPNTPETPNNYMDDDGIPDLPPQRFNLAQSAEGPVLPTSIEFDKGGSQISKKSYKKLDQLASMLKKNSAIRLKIIGYSDNKGTPAAANKGNMATAKKISLQRADSVKNYLVLQGISETRLITLGMGFAPQSPIPPNDNNKDGRAPSRAIEFEIQ